MTNATASTLLELAARVEAAEGPDRELDCDIANAFNKLQGPKRARVTWHVGDYSLPCYTASLDAAMMLVPDKYRRADHIWPDAEGKFRTYLWGASNKVIAKGNGRTPALALVAASLRARAPQEASHD